MKPRFIMFRRGDVYYSEDTVTRKQHSLRTKDEAEALTLLHAKNESFRQFIDAKIGQHSEKPAEARERLVQLMGDIPRVELFARTKTPSRAGWGNEVESDVRLD